MFVSYAQNFEDVYLERLFGTLTTGTYVDIGAFSPDEDSVTHAFYEKGWSGINVEPVRSLFESFLVDRPRDINLNIAIGSSNGPRTLFSLPDTGLSSLVESNAVSGQAHSGGAVHPVVVEVRTLDSVWSEHLGDRAVEFLKIDVEGAELDVLDGASVVLSRQLAQVIIIEAIEPGRAVSTHSVFEEVLLKFGYSFAWFDGVNRWYLAPTMIDRHSKLAVPVHCFDHTITRRHQEALSDAARLREAADRLNDRAAEVANAMDKMSVEIAQLGEHNTQLMRIVAETQDDLNTTRREAIRLHSELEAVYASRAWRLTRGLRWLKDRTSSARQS